MKAQEYFEKYFMNITGLDVQVLTDNCNQMFKDFNEEVEQLLKQRNCKTDSAAIGVIRELNEKWNSVVAKADKKFGVKLFKRNVIWNIYAADLSPIYKRKPD